MASYGQTKVLKKLTLMYIGCHLHPTMIQALQDQFEKADTDQSGTVSPDEFHAQFCKSVGEDIPLECTNLLFEVIDTNENGVIDFSEFKACLLRSQISLNEDLLRKAFNYFDKDKSGTITKEELMQVFSSFDDLLEMYDPDDFDELLVEIDVNNDNKISYQEFLAYMCREQKA